MSYSKYIKEWTDSATLNKYSYILIVKDLECADYFPVYFNDNKNVQLYIYNIISESKLKVVETITVGTVLAQT